MLGIVEYLWLKQKVALKEIKSFAPEIYYPCIDSLKNGTKDLDFIRLHKESFEKCISNSFDISIHGKNK